MPKTEIQDLSLKFNGRVLHFDVFVNTAEDANELTMRISKAARGQVRAAVVTMCSIHEGDEAKELWATIGKMTGQVAADPRAEIVDVDGLAKIDAEADAAAAEQPPKHVLDVLKGSVPPQLEKLMPNFMEHMIGLLTQQALSKLPRDKKLEAIRYLAELVWPGSTRREGE